MTEPQNAIAPTDIEAAIFAEVQTLSEQTLNKHAAQSVSSGQERQNLFNRFLLDQIRVGVIYIGTNCEIECWNKNLEEMTGLASTTMLGMQLKPSTLMLCSEEQIKIEDTECPFCKVIETGTRSELELRLQGRSGREVRVNVTILPVIKAQSGKPLVHGAVVLINDTSKHYDMERKLKSLYEMSSLDSLTQVANRAMFEACTDEYIDVHRNLGNKCCLIICDIDFFKKINDNYGHHIGDQALVAFAQLLKSFVRNHDMVARYGGEEFVILCANCDLSSGVERAEEIRLALNRTPQSMLNGKSMTASFGVSELREGDSITDLFVRADEALYKAKESGRNQVVSASNESTEIASTDQPTGPLTEVSQDTGIRWSKKPRNLIFCEEFSSSSPLEIQLSKLAGYIREFNAVIIQQNDCQVSFEVEQFDRNDNRKSENFKVHIEFQSGPADRHGNQTTALRVSIHQPQKRLFRPVRSELHHYLVKELRTYLMINNDDSMLKIPRVSDEPGGERI